MSKKVSDLIAIYEKFGDGDFVSWFFIGFFPFLVIVFVVLRVDSTIVRYMKIVEFV